MSIMKKETLYLGGGCGRDDRRYIPNVWQKILSEHGIDPKRTPDVIDEAIRELQDFGGPLYVINNPTVKNPFCKGGRERIGRHALVVPGGVIIIRTPESGRLKALRGRDTSWGKLSDYTDSIAAEKSELCSITYQIQNGVSSDLNLKNIIGITVDPDGDGMVLASVSYNGSKHHKMNAWRGIRLSDMLRRFYIEDDDIARSWVGVIGNELDTFFGVQRISDDV